jgi:alanine racemase
MVRCGIGIYGLWPSEENKESLGQPDFLAPALSFKTQITQIKKVIANEKIGYGCTYDAKKDMTIGIIPVGYYEGFDRGLSNTGVVLVSGKRCPIVGRICMNISIVDVTGITVKVGDEVVIIGKQNGEEITVDEIAEKIGTINYEVVTRIPTHVERKFI